MTDNDLRSLNQIPPPDPSDEARRAALAAAMEAYDRAHEPGAAGRQGMPLAARLKSIFDSMRKDFGMDIRVPIAVAAVGLLLVPLTMQLNTTTSLTPPPPFGRTVPQAEGQIAADEDSSAGALNEPALTETDRLSDGRRELGAAAATGGEATVTGGREQTQNLEAPAKFRDDFPAPAGTTEAEPAPPPAAQLRSTVEMQSSEVGGADTQKFAVTQEERVPPPQYERSGDKFTAFDDAQVFDVASQPVSTFSIDVDTASYAYVRRSLEEGRLPAADAVRVEEMINYFDYAYPEPDSATVPFAPTIAVYPTPWNPDTELMQIGIRGFSPAVDTDQPSNLVFLIDSSGSMDEPDKLPLVKRAFEMLLGELDGNDTVSIVTYAGSAGTVLMPTPASEKAKILDAIEHLSPGGRTAGAAGIEEAYRLAERAKVDGGVNRVILATDGDFNVGISSPEALESFITARRDEGIFLSVLGFGTGNYNDALMQALAQNGNGVAAYIDSFAEARKVLVEEANSTLVTIAKDVKIQIEFNPAAVAEYRLVGYETRALNREDFNNDRVDAGDVGAGHTVTAIYEITPVGAPRQGADPLRYESGETTIPDAAASDEIAFFRLRYKLPDEATSRLIEQPVTRAMETDSMAAVSDDMRFAAAVAAFGQKLRGGRYASRMSYDEIASLALSGRGADRSGYRGEFVSLVDIAKTLAGE